VTDGVRRLNALPDSEAEAALRDCCASRAWVRRMLSQRPFKDADEVYAAAERIWGELARDDRLEAFRGHPRIGERAADRDTGGRAAAWSAGEQAGVAAADAAVRAALAEGNRAYEERFGWIYLVCASGRDAGELLEVLRRRLDNDPEAELRVAAAEQALITRLRLEKLLTL
jgi:OHCU decarboxylase